MPTEAELKGTGFTPEDYEHECVGLWPENERAINLFSTLSTQWRYGGMGGATGLDYSPFFLRMDRMRLHPDDYEILFADIRVIESEALSIMNKKPD